MKIHLKLFSVYKDIAGIKDMTISIRPGMTIGELLQELLRRYPKMKAYKKTIMIAVNRDYVDVATELRHNDEVAVMPPVSGG